MFEMLKAAKAAKHEVIGLSAQQKNRALEAMASSLLAFEAEILKANAEDLKQVDKLSRQRRRRKLCIAHAAEHDRIHQIHAHSNQRLHRNRNRDHEHLRVEFTRAQILFPPTHNFQTPCLN